MTAAQSSFLKAIPKVLDELSYDVSDGARNYLLVLLAEVPDSTIWGAAINCVMNHGREAEKVDSLIDQLGDQALDDCYTMAQIIGWEATFIILRIHEQNHK